MQLRKLIDKHFSESELITLCLDLALDYDNLSGDNKIEKVRELITYMDRRGRMTELLDLLSNERPQVSWNHPDQADVQIAPEVRGFLETAGYEILNEVWENRYVIFQTQLVLPGEILNRWLFCKDLGVTLNDVKLLEENIAKLPDSKGWIITGADVMDVDAQRHTAANPDITAHTLARFYRQMLQCENYLQKELIAAADEIEKYWINLECQVEGEGRFDLVEYVDSWLKKPSGHQLVLLGDFGTGKTWFCRYYASRLARRYLNNPDENRIPVLISLREYTTALNVEQMVTSTLVDVYNLQLPGGFKTFMHLNKWGRLLLIFDGFDEMEQHIEYSLAQRNYRELARTGTQSSKTVLTSRPLFFEGSQQLQTVLQISGNRLRFETLSLWDLNEKQIQELLRKRAPLKWKTLWAQVKRFSRLKDLASRPVMTHIIAETLPSIDDPDRIDSAALYRIYLNKWIEEACRLKSAHVEAVKGDVLTFIRDLAWDLFNSRATKTISLSELRERSRNRTEFLEFNLILRQLLVHDKQTGNYTFPHVSFIEYFVAETVIENIIDGKTQFLFAFSPTSGVLGFLTDMMRKRPDIQEGLLNAMIEVDTSEQAQNLVALLERIDEKQRQEISSKENTSNPIRPVISILKMASPTGPNFALNLSQHVVAALGKEEFLADFEKDYLLEAPSQVRHFLLELWGNPSINPRRTLKFLNQVIHQDVDNEVRLHAVQVLGRRQGKAEAETLIETLGNESLPADIRRTCIESIQIKALPDDASTHLLNILHHVIADEECDFDLRADCVTRLQDYNTHEALEPLILILKDFDHELWTVSAYTLSKTSVLSIANSLKKEVILPNQQNSNLARQVAFLKKSVATIEEGTI